MNEVRAWVRWEDWTNVAAGIYMILVPAMFTSVSAASANAYTTGAVVLVVALLALAYPRTAGIEWVQLIVGAWLFIAPWSLGFAAVSAASWNAWIVGAIVMILAVACISELGHGAGAGGEHLPHAS